MMAPLSVATLPVIRSMLDEAVRKNNTSGVIGIRARPEWAGPCEFAHGEATVRVVPCGSALAVREAIATRDRAGWLVVLTDREDDDLGAGVRAHILSNRLRTPDPWAAVRVRFSASGMDAALITPENHRDIATGLLSVTPTAGWPPAPGGVLTRDHAFGAVAQEQLAFPDPVVDLASTLLWTAEPELSVLIGGLREDAGSALADAVLEWIAGRCGALAAPVGHLLRTGTGRDTVPLGVIAGVFAAAAAGTDAEQARIGREALIRLEPHLGRAAISGSALQAWGAEAESTLLAMQSEPSHQRHAESLLSRADELLAIAKGEGAADRSDWLKAGLSRRFAVLADALRRTFAGQAAQRGANPDAPWLGPDALAAIEDAWGQVAAHRLAARDRRTGVFHAAVRLARYLALDCAPASQESAVTEAFGELAARHMRQDSWADLAVNDAAIGVSDPDLAGGVATVLSAATARRAAHDEAFARRLARYAAQHSGRSVIRGIWHIEDVLGQVVFPLASVGVLLLVLDGMAASSACEIIASLTGRVSEGWAEALLPGTESRAAALTALPSLTEVSRAALLTGSLVTGGQEIERSGYRALCRAANVTSVDVQHKAALDTSAPGVALSDDLIRAIADTDRAQLVTCVLNTIDDALDRSDPGGTEWTAAAVRHLEVLLDQARRAGRVVVLTADHGHIVERRQGAQRSYPGITSTRSRAGNPAPADGEVLVTGERVLLPAAGGPAVLAVDEKVRFGPLKAGYHGGASPAEVIVPVAVLVSGAAPDGSGLRLAAPQEPEWWTDPVLSRPLTGRPGRHRRPGREPASTGLDPRLRSAPGGVPTLFDEPEPQPAEVPDKSPAAGGDQNRAGGRGDVTGQSRSTARQVIESAAYAGQRKIAGRLSVADDRVADLLTELLDAPDSRLSPARAALALGVPLAALRGAILHVQRLLNIEGYAVLRVDADGATVILDEALLGEQFGIQP